MSYAETYSNLSNAYQYDNFEIIAEVIDTYFHDLFQLNILDSEVTKDSDKSSYIEFFDWCMQQLKDLHTPEEVVAKLNQVLNTPEVDKKLLQHFMFVPPVGNKKSKQLGYIEKVAVGDAESAEPLTYLDMRRLTIGLKHLNRHQSTSTPPVNVAHLAHLKTFGPKEIKELKESNRAFLLNLNKNLKATPKWAVVDLTDKDNPRVYCETALTEVEKNDVDSTLNIKVNNYEGGNANSLVSTGYTAIAWLDNNITKAWNFDVSADFGTLKDAMTLAMFGGDNPGLSLTFGKGERERFCTKAFSTILDIDGFYGFGARTGNGVNPGFIWVRLNWLANLGEVEGEKFALNDFAAIVRIVGQKNMDWDQIQPYTYKEKRTLPPRFNATIVAHPGLIDETPEIKSSNRKSKVKLTIPEVLDVSKLIETHEKECRATHTSSGWISSLYGQVKRKGDYEEFYATMIILALIRSKAKKSILSIDLPNKFNLNKEEIDYIVANLGENPFVTEFTINDNSGLKSIKTQLLPVFARNRWLEANGYRPPFVGNYWKEAAKYWITYLHENENILGESEGYDLFKGCVLEMGLKGLEELLKVLQDESDRETIERIYGHDTPAFYAACPAEDYAPYLKLLLKHIKSGLYFPYSELGISYQPGNNKTLIELIAAINKVDKFEKISLTDCLKSRNACQGLLQELLKSARDEHWVGLIAIPELEDKTNVDPEIQGLRAQYTLLNDLILQNRHTHTAEKLNKSIKSSSNFVIGERAVKEGVNKKKVEQPITVEGAHIISALDNAETWPLKKGGVTQLQLQQQQQIQQNRQIQQEQQKVVINIIEEALTGDLVTYKNIDNLLRDFYKELALEHPINKTAATLWNSQKETLLQGFFHTWINANPDVNGSEIIQKMTPEAAKALLRKHALLTSGLNPNNLPKGFYTQQSKDGNLVLCYSPELAYVNPPTPMTINLEVHTPVAEQWKGDFRQIDMARYIDKPTGELNDTDWQNIAFFVQLQKNKKDYTEDYNDFLRANPARARGVGGIFTGDPLVSDKNKIVTYWPVFMQVWQYAGAKGIEQFLKADVSSFTIPLFTARDILLEKQPEALQTWARALPLTNEVLRGLGQIYYLHGHESLTLFLTKLNQIDAALGRSFFDAFFNQVIARSENCNCFMDVSFFTSMDRMMDKLSPKTAENTLKVWQSVIENHMRSVGWDNIEALWRGFDYFINELNGLDLKLEGDEFANLPPQNMLIAIDRILASLKQIPDQDEKTKFLKNLGSMDLTHGGVHYALQHERFKHFDEPLKLQKFQQGTLDAAPATYAPDLEKIFDWNHAEAPLKVKRTIASQPQFNHAAFEILADQLGNDKRSSREELLWLLHTQYSNNDGVAAVLSGIKKISPDFKSLIAEHLFHAVYINDNQHLMIQLDAMKALELYKLNPELLAAYPNGTVLEAVTILHQANRWDLQNDQLMQLLESKIPQKPDYPEFLNMSGYKLAALFGALSQDKVSSYFEKTQNLKPIVQISLRLLINQLLSVDYDKSDLESLTNPENWDGLLTCIELMNKEPAQAAKHRIAFIEVLNEAGLQFKYSKSGEFRALQNRVDDGPVELSFFIDHEERLWNFMKNHIVVPVNGDAKEALKPLMMFFKVLQLNRTYLNEVEPLLASLEDTPAGMYWSAGYFNGLLRALQPESEEISFPISLLKVMLKEMAISAKPIDSVEKKFPEELVRPIQSILQNLTFNRNEQAVLCQIALREFEWNGNVKLLNRVIETLSAKSYANSRSHVLDIMAKAKNYTDLETRFEDCCWLLQHPNAAQFSETWTQTSALWLKALSSENTVKDLFDKIKSDYQGDLKKQVTILHIFANSTLNMGLRKAEDYKSELKRKAPKLVDALATLLPDELERLAQCYPRDPSPGADDVLRMIKKHQGGVTWAKCLDKWLRTPYPEARADFGNVAATRDADLQRMIVNTKISGKESKVSLSAKDATRLTLIFAAIKQLESGKQHISGYAEPISKMSQTELSEAFKVLSHMSAEKPHNDELRAQIWAIMFEVLGRTTRKYPHLAQQFALIANDVCVTAGVPRVLQLATGEGKTHFVAMRAARNAGLGKTVDVCTAKRSLAQRDLLDYQNFFDYLGFKTAFIHSKSSRDTYTDANIHYTTTGDLSLFIDEQSYMGTPIDISRENRVALFDEFDFIRFEEGRKTEYNYARPTGKTPKQMTWFYQAVNEYYNQEKANLKLSGIDRKALEGLIRHLLESVGEHEEKGNLVRSIIRDKLQLVQWLQSAHEAHELQWGGDNGFTVREVNIEVGDESYPMREIIPLSSDNQPMFGSTFSSGVHQLLAVRLNTEAKLLPDTASAKKKAQNFHIHPESHIISSQVAAQRIKQLWGSWEGFSGTISLAQSDTLYNEQGTEVLHVPTNQNDLRLWHKPNFYDQDIDRREALVKQLRHCFAKKQSILFSCKNDAQVRQLEEYLNASLSADELKQIIFYTNEEERTPAEVLSDKQSKEHWQGGKKQQGIGLLASGFGRGDNVGVEAVFLFDVNDTNDKLQKGGRTARNGEEGEVFQFYLVDELRQEEERLNAMVEAITPDQAASIHLAFVASEIHDADRLEPQKANERRFERVMLLREYVFTIQNEANQGYRNALAQLSSWGMDHLGKIKDLQFRQELSIQFSYMMKAIDKKWIDISSKKDNTIDVKIGQIETAIAQMSIDFAERYNILNKTDIQPVALEKRGHTQFGIKVPALPAKITKREKAIGAICLKLTRLSDIGDDYSQVAQIPKAIQFINDAEDKNYLYRFAKEIDSCETVADFYHKMNIALDHVSAPSQPWNVTLTSAEKEIPEAEILNNVDDALKKQFYDLMQGLRSELQTQVINKLKTAELNTVVSRVKQIIPVLTYLKKFSFDQQAKLGEEYIVNLDVLLKEIPEDLLLHTLNTSSPISYKCFYGTWRLAKSVQSDGVSLNELMSTLVSSLNGTSEQRIRMLAIWESWSTHMERPEAKIFLMNFAKVMEHSHEGINWDNFKNLVEKTQDWWNREDGAYQPHLLKLWQDLSEQGDKLPALKDYIRWNLKLEGKSWYQNVKIGIDILPAGILSRHASEFDKYWQIMDDQKLDKNEKSARFKMLCTSFRLFYQAISLLPASQREQMVELLKGLDGERIGEIMSFVYKNQKVLIQKPQLLHAMLNYMSNPERSLACVDLLGEALLRSALYQAAHPNVDIAHLIKGVDRFMDKDEEILVQLLALFNPVVTAHPLFDNAAEFLAKRDGESQKQVLGVMQKFYSSDTIKSYPKAKSFLNLLDDEGTRSLFSFETNESNKVRDDRIIWMHLLHRNVFETTTHDKENGFDYAWDKKRNDAYTQHCFNHYKKHMDDILSKRPEHGGRGLDVSQQMALLHLTDEFQVIGTQLRPGGSQWKQLTLDLKQLGKAYQSSWFKSQERMLLSSQMEKLIEGTVNGVGDTRSSSRYLQLISALHLIKLNIIESDMKQNETRWFKLHRGGQSRLYDTLSKMEDAVLSHWAKDVDAAQGIQAYDAFNRQEFLDLTEKLRSAVQAHWEEHYDPSNYTYHDKSKRFARFFSSSATEAKFNSLRDVLNAFNSGEDLSGRDVNTLIIELQVALPSLPGHIATLAKEVLNRGDSFKQHLFENSSLDDVKATVAG